MAALTLVGGAHRHGDLVDDDLVVGHVAADVARGGQHVLQVGRAVLVGRRADGDELDGADAATASSTSVVKCRRPAATLRRTMSSRPGS